MENIELVIKMSQESYNNLKIGCIQRVSYGEMIEAIKNGTPLPKGHGRLIDENELCEGRVSNDHVVIAAKCAHTIIESGGEHEDSN